MSSTGRFIVLEGIDGSGKSELSLKIVNYINSIGIDVVLTAEPSDSWIGDVLRLESKPVSPLTDTLLYVADRAEHTSQIRKWISSGKWVVCDRYIGSTLAYQGASLSDKVENSWEWIKTVNAPVAIQPDLTFLLKISPETAMERLCMRASVPSRFEKLSFLKRVAENYDRLAIEDKSYKVIDGSLNREDVFSDTIHYLKCELLSS